MLTAVRTAAALLLVGATAGLGVVSVGTSGAVAAAPDGGCWTYVHDPLDPDLGAAPGADVSTALEPWTVEDGQVLLGSSGATTTGGTREVVLGISSGPVLSSLPAAGTASVLLSVDGVPLETPLTTEYAAEAGQPVRDVVVRGSLPVGDAGAHEVRLDAVYFDVPAEGHRTVCNGQAVGEPGGTNPATEPLPTTVTSPFTAVAASTAAVTDVTGQQVTTAARAGNLVTVDANGFPSSAPASATICVGTECTDAIDLWVQQDGTAQVAITVPEGMVPGAATVTVTDGTTSATTDLTVLGEPLLSASEEPGTDTTTVSLTGSSWDPAKQVTIRGLADDGTATGDPALRVAATDTGGFEAAFEVTDPETATIAATQGGLLSATYSFSGQIGTTPPVTPPVTPPAVTPPVEVPVDTGVVDPPVDIPEPEEIPVEEVPGEEPTVVEPTLTEELAVSEARLDGNATLAEWFGGAVRRDLVFLVSNVGDATVENPVVRVSVGRSPDLEPEIVDAEVGVLDPGEQAVVTVPLELPMASFGTYHVVGQVGETAVGGFTLEWTTYPWGLFALNVLGALLIAWGVRRRLEARRPAPYTPVVAVGTEDAVVDLTAAEAWWAHRDGTPRVPVIRVDEPDEGLGAAVVDLDAAERWWSRRAGEKPSQAS